MAELTTLERLLDEKERLELYLELLQEEDIEMIIRLIERRLATLDKAIDAK